MAKNATAMMAIGVVLMMIVFQSSIVNGQVIWLCPVGSTNCNNGFCCPSSTPVCGGIGRCCPSNYPIYYNNRCYGIVGKSSISDTKVDAVVAIPGSS
ncbi:unnamed protein product [Adineta ricciae]|uniref:Uncharacterized protein n=1 Tax=Adineta ricciae TaxID=249248 RepID=A0A814DB55_ADIRI|nr:unnamed protein product [Adineta ricciae]CAF0951870.1 unnamed protein product [Adineta ricciae]